ncbi:Protein of unknown function [Allopseudospirillum japonicum]|uniref:DUF3549 domain-containing protein n=1 Tax=Allopseudospirillum japonicum TaxID=64971 RepID=A0A1H6TQX0_9GAMM|nr:DUF3549 family protein [Allopseudospirillum japonicum]SEI79617.1 Protein of unknown function [Allopseudospirillum japonicum]
MSAFHTLTDFFERSGACYQAFDLGRRVQPLDTSYWQAFESGQRPYAYPWQQTACLGLVFYYPSAPQDPLVWFLKLPLDEQGFIQGGPRDAFVKRLLETLGQQAQQLTDQATSVRLDPLMENNPLVFTPDQERQAIFHAYARQHLQQAPSTHYAPAYAYLTQPEGNAWQTLSLQGIADVALQHTQAGQAQALATQVPAWPTPVLTLLARCLEAVPVAPVLAKALAQNLALRVQNPQTTTTEVASLLRALSHPQTQWDNKELQAALMHPTDQNPWYPYLQDPEVLTTLALKYTHQLEDLSFLQAYLQVLAQQDMSIFKPLLKDLLFMPNLRVLILALIRQAPTDSALAKALTLLVQEAQTKT